MLYKQQLWTSLLGLGWVFFLPIISLKDAMLIKCDLQVAERIELLRKKHNNNLDYIKVSCIKQPFSQAVRVWPYDNKVTMKTWDLQFSLKYLTSYIITSYCLGKQELYLKTLSHTLHGQPQNYPQCLDFQLWENIS